MTEVLETRGEWRVVIAYDECPEMPDGDGYGYVFTVRFTTDNRAVVELAHADGDDDDADGWRMADAIGRRMNHDHFAEAYPAGHNGVDDEWLARRYAAICVAWLSDDRSGETDYLFVVTAEQFRKWHLGEMPTGELRETATNMARNEWRAWRDGDVYTADVQRLATWRQTDGASIGEEMTRWESVQSCGGFYGYEYAAEAALELLDDCVNDGAPS